MEPERLILVELGQEKLEEIPLGLVLRLFRLLEFSDQDCDLLVVVSRDSLMTVSFCLIPNQR